MKSKENDNKKNERTKKKETMTYQDVLRLDYKPAQARDIIRQAKRFMVKKGYPYYNGKRVGTVPIYAVKAIIGVLFSVQTEGDKK